MVGWKVMVELPVPAPNPGSDPPRMRQKQGCSHGKESDCDEASAGVVVQAWGSAALHIAWPEGHVSSHSAFRMPVASLLVHNDCTQPGKSHHGQGRGQIWTYLKTDEIP